MALTLTDNTFDKEVLNSDKLAMVDFWAVWCGPCRMLAPSVEQLSEEYKDQVVVGKLDVDNNPEVAQKFGIRSLPTILFFKNGEIVDRQVGAVPKSTLANKIKANL
jgi:thioredoxin 1